MLDKLWVDDDLRCLRRGIKSILGQINCCDLENILSCCCVTAGSSLRAALEIIESRLAAHQQSLPNSVQIYLLYQPHWQETSRHLQPHFCPENSSGHQIKYMRPARTEAASPRRRFTTRKMKIEGKRLHYSTGGNTKSTTSVSKSKQVEVLKETRQQRSFLTRQQVTLTSTTRRTGECG